MTLKFRQFTTHLHYVWSREISNQFQSVSIREDMENRKVLLITCFAGISLCFHLPPGDADEVRQVGDCVASDGGSGHCRQITQCKSAGN